MAIFFSISKSKTPGREIAIDCPMCKTSLALAQTHSQIEIVKLFFLLPVATHNNTILVCNECGAELITRFSIDQLHHKSTSQINKSIVPNGGMLAGILFLTALFFCWIPIFNLLLAALVPIANYRSRGANRAVGYIPLIIALVFNIWLVWSVVSGPKP